MSAFSVGQLVSVDSRTWPGINRPGGVGKITMMDSQNTASVKYVIDGRTEKNIELQYIHLHSFDEGLRDRNMLLGRCSRCGSLRTDCGSCDVAYQGGGEQARTALSDSSSSSEDSVELENLKLKRSYQRYKRMQAKASQFWEQAGMGSDRSSIDVEDKPSKQPPQHESSSSDSSDDSFLKQCLSQLAFRATPVPVRRRDGVRKVIADSGSSCSSSEEANNKRPLKQRSWPQSGGVLANLGALDEKERMTPPTANSNLDAMSVDSFSAAEDADSPMKQPDVAVEGTFIQPEGDADELPVDVVDRSTGLSYPQLIEFFDTTVSDIEKGIAKYKRLVFRLERDWRQAESSDKKRELRVESEKLHNEVIQRLVRDGNDQCQMALSKLTKKSFYRRYKRTVAKPLPYSHHYAREFKLDGLAEAVEDVISRTRTIGRHILEGDTSDENDDDRSSDSMTVPFSQSPTRLEIDAESLMFGSPETEKPLGLHPHATRKRRPPGDYRKAKTRKTPNSKRRRTRKRSGRSGATETHTISVDRRISAALVNVTSAKRLDNLTNTDLQGDSDGLSLSFSDSEDEQPKRSNRLLNAFDDPSPSITKLAKRRKSAAKRMSRNDQKQSGARTTASLDGASHRFPTELGGRGSARLGGAGFMQNNQRVPEEFYQRTRNEYCNRESIADRMQHWVNANTNHGGQEPVRRSVSTLRNATEFGVRDETGLDFSLARHDTALPVAIRREELFCGPETNSNPSIGIEFATRDPGLISNSRDHQQPTDSLSVIPPNTAHSIQRNPSRSSQVFSSIRQRLLQDNCRALQEHVCTADVAPLRNHIDVLVSSLQAIKDNVQSKLGSDDGVLFEIFGGENYKAFLEMVVLQLAESVVSLMHPTGWELQTTRHRAILAMLDPLRNHLAGHYFLLERISRGLLKEIGQQEWRCVRRGECIYISAFDPEQWVNFVSNGTKPTRSAQRPRLSLFEDCFPRCEVDTVWLVISYFSARCKVLPSPNETTRWQLVSAILSKGSLSVSSTRESSIPSSDQLDCAARDIMFLVDSICSGSMKCLPRRDKVVFDLLQKALSLPEDSARSSGESGVALFPSLELESASAAIAREMSLGTYPRYIVTRLSNFLRYARDIVDTKYLWLGQPLLFPSSPILRSCVGLLCAWKALLPETAKRIGSFEKTCLTLAKQIGGKQRSGHTSPETNSDKADLFQAAFNMSMENSPCQPAEKRAELFRQECAAWVLIIGMIPCHDQRVQRTFEGMPVNSQAELVWNLLGDETMKRRQALILAGDKRRCPTEACSPDGPRLLVASKACTFLLLSGLGALPSNSVGFLDSRSLVQYGDNRLQSLDAEFLFACLLACLDCASGSNDDHEVMSSIACCLIVAINYLDHWRHLSQDGRENAIGPIADKIWHMASNSSVVERSLLIITSSPFCDKGHDLSFQVLVSLLRRLVSCHVGEKIPTSERGSLQTDVGNEDDENDDLFGDLDDSLLAEMDLGQGVLGSAAIPKTVSAGVKLAVELLTMSTPSNRNSIHPHPVTLGSFSTTLTAQGMALVSKRFDCLCCLVVDALDYQSTDRSDVKQLIVLSSRFERLYKDQGDCRHLKSVSQFFARELCKRHGSTLIAELVYDFKMDFLHSFMDSVLDTRVLKKLPTCNLVRLDSRGGPKLEEKAFSELLSFERNCHCVASRLARDKWGFGEDLGKALLRHCPDDAIAQHLVRIRHSLSSSTSDRLAESVEKEIFHRFLLVQNFLRLCRSPTITTFVPFERFALTVMAALCSHLLILFQKLAVVDEASKGVQGVSYHHLKLNETVCCYSDLFASTAVTITSGVNRPAVSKGFESAVMSLVEDLICPIVREDNVDLFASLRSMTLRLTGALTDNIESQKSVIHRAAFNDNTRTYRCTLRRAIVRRARELVMAFSSSPILQSPMFLKSISIIGNSEDKDEMSQFCAALLPKAYEYGVTKRLSESPLHQQLNNHFAGLETREPLSPEALKALASLSHKIVFRILSPQLTAARSNARLAVRLLRLLQHLIDGFQEAQAEFFPAIDTRELCVIARGIGAALQLSLIGDDAVNEELLQVVFSCGRSVISISASAIDIHAVGWLVDWAFSFEDSSGNASGSLHGRYLWAWCKWMAEVGTSLANLSETDFKSFRSTMRDRRGAMEIETYMVAWPSLDGDTSCALQHLDQQLFPIVATARNVYATKSQALQLCEGVLEGWTPATNTRHVASQFCAKVQYACSL